MERNTRLCPICSCPATFKRRGRDSFYQVTQHEVDLFACDACGSVFQDPIPDRAVIAEFYPTGYWQERETRSLQARLQGLYIHLMLKLDLMQWVRRLGLQPGARVLDVGCSRGDWLARIRDQGYAVSGLEADPRGAAYARRVFGLTIEEVDGDTWEPEAGAYDVICFFHLLEHLRDPVGFLGKVHRALAKGGKILVRVPNARSWQSRILGVRWKGWETPRHIVMFSSHALSGLIAGSGFAVEHVSTWSLRDGPPCLASSLFPSGEPTWQEIHRRASPVRTILYLLLTWILTPLELFAAVFGRGAMVTVIAQKLGANSPNHG